jgi:hypothetical protein
MEAVVGERESGRDHGLETFPGMGKRVLLFYAWSRCSSLYLSKTLCL